MLLLPLTLLSPCGTPPLLRRLSNREYLIEAGSVEERRVLLGLADILFAYAYDHRTTTGDASVESAWTVAVLSPLLSWLEVRQLLQLLRFLLPASPLLCRHYLAHLGLWSRASP